MTRNDKEVAAAVLYWTGSALIVAGAAVACGLAGGLIAAGTAIIVFTILNTR